jgi:acid phosphatase
MLIGCLLSLFLGWWAGSLRPKGLLAEDAPAPKSALPFPMAARLGANLYVQDSAEYRACCQQIYFCAEQRLLTMLESAKPRPARPAVVLDLDETVVDNSAFQTYLFQNRLEYTDALWADYEENYPQDVRLVPGVKRFLDRAEALGVTAVFISNRSQRYEESTLQALARLGVEIKNPADRLFLKPLNGTSDKSARREMAEAKYNVLMLFGDNLRDFSEVFTAPPVPKNAPPEVVREAIQKRATLADAAQCRWGYDWFVLPNPVYGEWEKLIGRDPYAILRPTSMPPRNSNPK